MLKRLNLDSGNPDPQSFSAAVSTLRRGGVIVYPTDTLYGIGVDPFNEDSLLRLQSAKRRLEHKPILLIAHSIDAASTVVNHFPVAALILAEEFWPGPLTLVLPARAGLPAMVTQNTGTVGVRLPSNRFCLRLAEEFGGPITSTSANISGQPTPGTIDEIEAMLGDSIDLYLDAGPLALGKPSTLVDTTTDPPTILREGVLTRDQLTAVISDIR